MTPPQIKKKTKELSVEWWSGTTQDSNCAIEERGEKLQTNCKNC